MRTSCLVVASLVLVFGAAATTALAEGGPPEHAAGNGPPDPGPERGSPAHAASSQAATEEGESGDDPTQSAADTSSEAATAEGSDTGEPEPSTAEDVASSGTRDDTADGSDATETRTADESVEDLTHDQEEPAARLAVQTTAEQQPAPEDEADRPLAGDDVAPSSGGSANAATANDATTPTSVTGLVPGALIGAIGVLALAVHHQPHRTRRRPEAPDAEPETAEPVDEPEPTTCTDAGDGDPGATMDAVATEGGIVGVITAGQQALDEGEIEAAIGWFETAIELAPGLQVARFCLGLCLDEQGRLGDAERELRQARKLEDDPMAAYAHASVLARLGRCSQALDALERLAPRVPELRDRLREDDEMANLRDHPRFLGLLGEL
jgi:hypothetical protein